MSFEELVFVLLDFRASLSQHFDLIRHPYDESLRDNVTTGEQGADYVTVERSDPRQTSFPMRQVFKKVRKILGRDLTPQKIAARVPRVFWINALAEWLLGQKGAVPQRQRMLLTLRTAVRVGCPF